LTGISKNSSKDILAKMNETNTMIAAVQRWLGCFVEVIKVDFILQKVDIKKWK